MKYNENSALEEKIIFLRQLPHYGLYPAGIPRIFAHDIPWHWHREFEFGFVNGGSVLYRTSRQEFVLHAGDGIFINSGVLHYLQPLEPYGEVRLYTQFIDGYFLTGEDEGLWERYIRPVMEDFRVEAVPLRKGEENDKAFLEGLAEGVRLAKSGEALFELRLRALFLRLWEKVFGWTADEPQQKRSSLSVNSRLKEMISFIQRHYREELKAVDIAQAAHISERECYRLFQSGLGMTPSDFLLSVRLHQAVELLQNTDRSILEIALETGFGSSSYFGRRFKECHHMTPGQYRSQYMRYMQEPSKWESR